MALSISNPTQIAEDSEVTHVEIIIVYEITVIAN